MWCVPELTTEFVERMEDLLCLYARKLDPAEPVICLDERPVVLREDAKRGSDEVWRDQAQGLRVRSVRHDDIFCIIEPLTGRRLTFASADRKRRAYVRALKKIAARYKHARRIHLVQDNLNTHFRESAMEVLGPLEGRRLWSWLDAAELEASLVSRECLGRERISSLVDLI